MIDIVISYDDNDSELGDYFEQSFNHLHAYFALIDYLNILSIAGLSCTEDSLKTTINTLTQQSFVFVGLLHGNDNQLLTENDILVDFADIDHLRESFFYSSACSTANCLGIELIKKGCLSYVGCNQDTYATYEDYYDIYINCENYCLKCFLDSNQTLEDCFFQMLSYFDQQISMLSAENDEILVAMELIGNRDSFVLLGNKELRRSDLFL